jgi:hypothetical protein
MITGETEVDKVPRPLEFEYLVKEFQGKMDNIGVHFVAHSSGRGNGE